MNAPLEGFVRGFCICISCLQGHEVHNNEEARASKGSLMFRGNGVLDIRYENMVGRAAELPRILHF